MLKEYFIIKVLFKSLKRFINATYFKYRMKNKRRENLDHGEEKVLEGLLGRQGPGEININS